MIFLVFLFFLSPGFTFIYILFCLNIFHLKSSFNHTDSFNPGKHTQIEHLEDNKQVQTYEESSNIEEIQHGQWKRIMLLVIAITVHNIPEGLAVGVGFGAIGSSSTATFESAR